MGPAVIASASTPATASLPKSMTTYTILLGLVLLLMANVPTTWANYEHYCLSDPFANQPRGTCGTDLIDRYEIVCHIVNEVLRKNSSTVVKRSAYPRKIDKDLNKLLVNKKDAMSFLSNRHSAQGVLCECCYNVCSNLELSQYCVLPNIDNLPT